MVAGPAASAACSCASASVGKRFTDARGSITGLAETQILSGSR